MQKADQWINEAGLARISQLTSLGLERKVIARVMGITEKTLTKWEIKYPEIKSALSEKESSDSMVETALLKRAVGYTHTEVVRQLNKDSGELEVVKTVEKDVMPSTTAQIFWLKNHCGYEWDDKKESEGGVVMLAEVEETDN